MKINQVIKLIIALPGDNVHTLLAAPTAYPGWRAYHSTWQNSRTTEVQRESRRKTLSGESSKRQALEVYTGGTTRAAERDQLLGEDAVGWNQVSPSLRAARDGAWRSGGLWSVRWGGVSCQSKGRIYLLCLCVCLSPCLLLILVCVRL